MKYFVIILLFSSTPVMASLHIGGSLIDTRLHNRDYKVVKESEPSLSYNIGYYKELPDKWVIDLTTNALLSSIKSRDERTIINKGTTLNIKSRVTYGSILVGKRFNRFVPSLLVSLVYLDKKIYSDNIYLNTDKSYGFVFGGNLNYFVTKKFSTSLFCLLPSSHIDLRFSCGGGVNYYF